MAKLSSGQKAAKTRAKKYAKASAKEKARIDEKRRQAAIKAAKSRKSKPYKKSKSSKKPNMIKAGKDAARKKRRYEGLTNPEDKKFYYDVMMVYSKRYRFSKPTCCCCKNTDWKFLVFDHIKNRPKSHKNYSGVSMARKLDRDGYPRGIQILCHNCNTGKEIYGGVNCPHLLSPNGQKRLKKVGLPLGRIFRK